ncbi:thiamine-phosphate kinase [Marinobacter sp. SS21]|uniref:thiamine-phosphate kinase n=1 Tax=Marinobacter sp. SS21 TaxID=2979460 RepID=UPI00232B90A5|nr:thiamine-phosphate kinase [Marinobacter sp. SS21]MDC0663050.1 thiamine-phosphate kinase [Marinobacter sp. SS21]
MGEFDLIRRYFLPLAGDTRSAAVSLGPGDDCAIQQLAPGTELAFSIDTMVEGVHFPVNYDPAHLAWRSLAAATSDLAAMGADPLCFTLALTLPEAQCDWLQGFADGLGRAAASFGLALAGGDTTRGPLTVTLQVHGAVPHGQALLRSGASGGDLVCVSGTLGDAGAALTLLGEAEPAPDARYLLQRYHRPEPRLALGRQLRGQASAAVDVSDGLVADLGHILAASGVGAEVDARRLPLSGALRRQAGEGAIALALYAGDDYELCVTIPPVKWERLPESARATLTIIGEISDTPGLRLRHAPKSRPQASGFDHFGETS